MSRGRRRFHPDKDTRKHLKDVADAQQPPVGTRCTLRRYATKKLAKGNAAAFGRTLRAERCQRCNGWHLHPKRTTTESPSRPQEAPE